MGNKIFLTIAIGLLGCSQGDKKNSAQRDHPDSTGTYSSLTLDEYKAFYGRDSSAFKTGEPIDMTIDFDCAVVLYPSDEEISEMKEAYGEEDFYIVADDSNWYLGMAIAMLDSLGIKMATVHGDSLKFKGESGRWDFDIKKDSLSGWNIILFSRTKGPRLISTVDITVDEIRDYFSTSQ